MDPFRPKTPRSVYASPINATTIKAIADLLKEAGIGTVLFAEIHDSLVFICPKKEDQKTLKEIQPKIVELVEGAIKTKPIEFDSKEVESSILSSKETSHDQRKRSPGSHRDDSTRV